MDSKVTVRRGDDKGLVTRERHYHCELIDVIRDQDGTSVLVFEKVDGYTISVNLDKGATNFAIEHLSLVI